MNLKNLATLILAATLGLGLSGCNEQTEKDMIAEAQFCLDKATTAAQAKTCTSGIASLQSKSAYQLKCAAGFISAGITSPEKLSKALDAVKENGAGTTVLLASLNFGSNDLAIQTADDCSKSGKSSLTLISAMAKSATVLTNAASVLGSCNTANPLDCDTQAIEDAINAIILDPTDPANEQTLEAVGSTIQTVYSATCGGTNNGNTDICNDINKALTDAGVSMSGSPIDIGLALLDKWKNP